MNRHHPYGRGGFDGGHRRGGHQGSVGPDRSHNFSDRGGGPSRGRGGWRGGRGGSGGGGGSYGGYGGPGGYDSTPQGDSGGYDNYESGPQDSYYQSGNYGTGMPEYGSSDQSGSYGQDYGDYEDGPGNYGPGGQGGYGRGGGFKRGGPQRRHVEIPESVIEERIQRERPCRTLFIRNVKYETPSEDVRRLFEEHGEIKTFFDLIANRGMVFVTYFDLRAAERARERLQGSEISGRPIDVHYSLPRDDKNGDKEKNQQLQGTLLVTLKDSASGQPIDDGEIRRKFQQFGDVREVRDADGRPDQRYVEFFDTRACEEAHDRLRHQGLQDGVMEIVFASELDDPRTEPPRRGGGGGGDRGFERGGRDWDNNNNYGQNRRGNRGRGRGRGWGGGSGGGGGGGGGRDDWDQRGSDWGEDRGRQFEDEFGRGPRRGGFENRYNGNNNSRRGGYGGPPGPVAPMGGPSGPPSYGGAPPPPPTFSQPSPVAPPAGPDDRLEQAKKVQQLLAALKGPAPASPAAPVPTGPPSMSAMPPIPTASASMPYYAPPPGPQPPYPGAYGAPPPPPAGAQTGAPPPPASNLAGLPPNILALLQQSAQNPTSQASPPIGMGQSPYGAPPQAAAPPPGPPGSANGQGYQQLMAYLSQKRPQ